MLVLILGVWLLAGTVDDIKEYMYSTHQRSSQAGISATGWGGADRGRDGQWIGADRLRMINDSVVQMKSLGQPNCTNEQGQNENKKTVN